MARSHLVLFSAALNGVVLDGCALKPPEPDARWQVTLTGDTTNCLTDGSSGYQKTFTYEVTWPNKPDDVTTTEIRIDGESFATGQTSGCSIEYQTPTWLEERDQGYLKWSIAGRADQQQNTGGCDIDDGLDWDGVETITIEESTDNTVPEGCTYTLLATGKFLGTGGG